MAVVLAIVAVLVPGPEGDLLLFSEASGAVTGVWLPLPLAIRSLEVPGFGDSDIRGGGRSVFLAHQATWCYHSRDLLLGTTELFGSKWNLGKKQS